MISAQRYGSDVMVTSSETVRESLLARERDLQARLGGGDSVDQDGKDLNTELSQVFSQLQLIDSDKVI